MQSQQQHHNKSNSGRRRHTVQSVDTNSSDTSTIQWYDSDGSTLLVDFPHNHDDGDQSADYGYANQLCSESDTQNHSNTATNNTNTNNNNNTYDKYGRCIHHPQIQLRRRQHLFFSSEWKTILKVCPDCCIEELNRLYASGGRKVNDKKKENELDETELYDDESTDEEEDVGTDDETDD